MRFALVLGVLASAALVPPVDRAEKAPAVPVLLLPGVKGPFRLGLAVVVDERAPTVAWDAFLDRLFDWFDRDGDGWLSRAEVARMFPLPLPGGKELMIDFPRLDADGNGKASRAELKSFCRRNGFGPVVVLVRPPSADDVRLAELFLRRLGSSDGKLTRAGLRQSPELLRSCDLNEDEYLDLAELLDSAPVAARPEMARVSLGEANAETDAVLRLDIGVKTRPLTIQEGRNGTLRLVPASAPSTLHRLHGPEGRWSMALRTTPSVPDMKSAGEFLIAQFTAAVGERAALTKADVEEDVTLSGLQELFRYADRNGDDHLTLAELRNYLALVELGVRAQVWLRVTDHGRNPFHFLDSDGDNRLSYSELMRAGELLAADSAGTIKLPRQFQVTIEGPSGVAWGGVAVPGTAKRLSPAATEASPAPRWFQAMDRNGDGVISPWEFLGPPEVFSKLDTNGDGVISREEATRAAP